MALAGVVTPVRVHGRDLRARPKVQFGGDGSVRVNAQFRAWLGDVELEQVEYVSVRELSATVPGELAAGLYDLTVLAPDGQRGVLAAAFEVAVCTGDSDCDDSDVCNGIESCVDGVCVDGEPMPMDNDGDGYVAMACGGDDCDDEPEPFGCGAACNPGVLTDACDGYDNDCDPATADGSGDAATGAACDGSDADLCLDDVYVACVDSALVCSDGTDDVEGPTGNATCTDELDNDCDGALDSVDPDCGANVAPLAVLTVTPSVGVGGTTPTIFVASATASSDDHDALASLSFEWNWSDGAGFAAGGSSEAHSYASPGIYNVAVRVTDSGGLVGEDEFEVTVVADGTLVTVTSVAELISALAAAQTTPGHDTLFVPAGTTLSLTSGLQVQSDAAGIDLVGDGAIIDGTGITATASCVTLSGGSVRLAGFEITGCSSYAINLTAGSGTQVMRCFVHDNAKAVAWSAAGNTFGPHNEVAFHRGAGSDGIQVNEPAVIMGNRLHHNSRHGINLNHAHKNESRVWGNHIYANDGDGILLTLQTNENEIYHNTISGNAGNGVTFGLQDAENVVVGNAITFNGGWALANTGANSKLARLDFNDYHRNVSGICSDCVVFGASDLFVDPLYLDRVVYDFRLLASSLLVDAGDVGVTLDLNGVLPGTYNGAAPDIGACESP